MARNRHLEAASLTISRSDDNPVRALPRDLETDAGIATLLLQDDTQIGVKSQEFAEKLGDHAIDRLGTWAMVLGWITQATSDNGYAMPEVWILTQTGRRCAAQRIDLWNKAKADRAKQTTATAKRGRPRKINVDETSQEAPE